MNKTKIDIFGEHSPLKMMAEYRFWKVATPKIFEYLGWILIIGALAALSQKTNDIYLKGLHYFSYAALFLYTHEHINTVEFHFAFIKRGQIKRITTILLSGTLTIIVIQFISHVIDLLPILEATRA